MKKALIVSLVLSISSLLGQQISWTNPITISSPNVSATNPWVIMDANGNVIAVWVENNSVLANTLPFGGSWGTATTLSSTTASSPRVKVDSNGNATAIWIENGMVTVATLPFNGTWTGKTALSGSGASEPRLAVDATGNVVASWTLGSTIQSATKLVNGSWPASPDTVSDSGIVSDSSRVSIGNDGTVGMIWHGVQNSIDTIYAVTKPVNGVWGTVQTLTSSSAANPRIVVDGSGNCLALWYQFTNENGYYSNVKVMSSNLPKNGVWQTPVMISQNVGITNPNLLQASMGVDPSGVGIAAWNISFDGQTFFIEAAVRMSNGKWSAPQDLDATFFCNSLSMEVDSAGNVVMAHGTGNPSLLQIAALNLDADSFAVNSWSNPSFISTGTSNSFPGTSGSSTGSGQNVVVAWENWDGTNTNIQVSTGTASAFFPPSNLTGIQNQNNFGVFTEYYNTLTWSGSSDPNLQGYVVFRNGLLLATLDANILQYVDHNRDPNQSDTYAVAAFGSGSEQSQLITVTIP